MNTTPMIWTPNAAAGAVYGARLRVESVAPAHAWKPMRPELVAFNQIDNSTGVSARKHRQT